MRRALRSSVLRSALVALALPFLPLAPPPPATASASDPAGFPTLALQAELPGSDGVLVEISGDTVVTRSGEGVLVFERDGASWPLRQTLVSPDPAAPFSDGAYFGGHHFAIDGDTIVVGASGAAIAHVFVRDGAAWALQQSLVTEDPEPAAADSVAFDGDTIAVGSQAAQAVYVFVSGEAGWHQQQKLTPAIDEGDFGIGVDVDGDAVVVSSARQLIPLDNGIEAHVFEREGTTWTERQRFFFGGIIFFVSVAIDGDTLALAIQGGATHIYVRGTMGWIEQQVLPGPRNAYVHAVDISGDTVVIGQTSTGSSVAARVLVYVRDGALWSEHQQLVLDEEPFTQFGFSVAIDDCNVAVTRFADLFGSTSAYVFVPAAPSIACPANVEVSAADGECSAVVEFDVDATGVPAPTVTCTPESGSAFPVGTTTVTCTAANGAGPDASCSFDVTVTDDEAPTISNASASPSVIWSPNHQMVDVEVSYMAEDNCSGEVSCSLSVASNEPVEGLGDGDTSPDWEVVDAHRVRLRAERSGTGTGRVYTITITCTDAAGNTSTRDVTVLVPKNQ